MKFLKLCSLLLASLLLATLLTPALLADPCAAAFVPSNNITLERNGMTWDYNEKTTGDEAILFRSVIDGDTGNKNDFVNAWEILKMEILLGEKMRKSIEEEPDVKLNETSETVELNDVEFWIPEEALGRIDKNLSITSRALVTYSFKEEIGPGTEIWLMGTPDSSVIIALPQGLDAEVTEGFDNKSLGFENNRIVLRGNFSSDENITIWLSENESLKTELQDMEADKNKSAENESKTGKNSTQNTGVNAKSGNFTKYFKNFLKEINRTLT